MSSYTGKSCHLLNRVTLYNAPRYCAPKDVGKEKTVDRRGRKRKREGKREKSCRSGQCISRCVFILHCFETSKWLGLQHGRCIVCFKFKFRMPSKRSCLSCCCILSPPVQLQSNQDLFHRHYVHHHCNLSEVMPPAFISAI